MRRTSQERTGGKGMKTEEKSHTGPEVGTELAFGGKKRDSMAGMASWGGGRGELGWGRARLPRAKV